MKAKWAELVEWDGGWNSGVDHIVEHEVDIQQYIMAHDELCAVCIYCDKIRLIPVSKITVIGREQ